MIVVEDSTLDMGELLLNVLVVPGTVELPYCVDVWLDRLTLELCPGGMTTVVGKGCEVDVVEDWELLLNPLVVLKADELPSCVEVVAGGVGMPGKEVSVE